jgi:2-polyprenyl-3-methyl-5-hydroxy-6-metoxy-1,4-benzoquinol methylase
VRTLDRLIQTLRLRQAVRRIPDGARVLDIGAYDDRLFRRLGSRLGSGVGVDPHVTEEGPRGKVVWKQGSFPDVHIDGPFDRVCLLAVIEHIPRDRHGDVARTIASLLDEGGRAVLTVPSPLVDRITAVLAGLRLIDGIDLDQHYGLHPDEIVASFAPHLRLVERARFELGLNHVLVFERSGS